MRGSWLWLNRPLRFWVCPSGSTANNGNPYLPAAYTLKFLVPRPMPML